MPRFIPVSGTRLFLLIACMMPSLCWSADTGEGLKSGLVNPGFHDQPEWFKSSFLDLREDVAEAADEGKRVILYFYQDGCPYCAKLLNENFTIRTIVDRTREHFQVIALNMWGDRTVTDLQGSESTEKAMAEALKVRYTPTLLFLDEQGQVVLRVNGYYPPHRFMAALDYVTTRGERRGSFRDYQKQHQTLAASGKLRREPGYLPQPLDLRAEQRSTGKPLLVLMEMKQCPPCDELHDQAFTRPEVRKSLQQFDIAILDIWSSEPLTTPRGEAMTANQWAEALNIQYAPSLLFFDARGEEVFRSEAYLKSFHINAALDYVLSGSYREQPNFQRYIQTRAEAMRERGEVVDLMQ
ncbi:MAG: thioredoxin fold domain-containing protein [Candidatus Thiodiazotropha sp.]